jgi:16S rRNA (adenine1518-N6/adenine1519-N6)-dimethyltransferase
MDSPARLLRELESHAKKRFGQHFLSSPSVVAKILRAASVGPTDRILEIGPGLGALTDAMLQVGPELLCVELDRDVVSFLRHRHPNLKLVEGDAASMAWDELLVEGEWKCVSNLPYNVGTKILSRLLLEPRVGMLVVMLQKEVADRIVARSGERKRGSLSVWVEAFASAKIAFRVPAGAFHPPPKVESAVVVLERHSQPRVPREEASAFEFLLRTLFAQPRKTIRNNLRSRLSTEVADALLERASIDSGRRPSTLELDEVLVLYGIYKGLS